MICGKKRQLTFEIIYHTGTTYSPTEEEEEEEEALKEFALDKLPSRSLLWLKGVTIFLTRNKIVTDL